MEIPEGIKGYFFTGPNLGPREPRRVVTAEEQQRALAFLVDVQAVCAKHGLELRSHDDYGIAVHDGNFAYCDEIWAITATQIDGTAWNNKP